MKIEEVFDLLGHITIFFATLDFLTTLLIYDIITDEYKKNHNPLRDNTTLKQKFVLLKNLKITDVKSEPLLIEIHNFIEEAISISEERNRFMHDQWVFDDKYLEKDTIRKIKIGGLNKWEIKTEESNHSLQDIQSLLISIGKMQYKVNDALKELKNPRSKCV
jgi:hypothetical protein